MKISEKDLRILIRNILINESLYKNSKKPNKFIILALSILNLIPLGSNQEDIKNHENYAKVERIFKINKINPHEEPKTDAERIKRLDILRKILSSGLDGIDMRIDDDNFDPQDSFKR